MYTDCCVSIAFIRFRVRGASERLEGRRTHQTQCCVMNGSPLCFSQKKLNRVRIRLEILRILLNAAKAFSLSNKLSLMMVRLFYWDYFLASSSSSFSWGGLGLSPLATSATVWPIVPAPDDR